LIAGQRLFRRTLLKFDRIAPGASGFVDQSFGEVNGTIVIDTDLSDDIHGLTVTNPTIADFDLCVFHEILQASFETDLRIRG
jgi:hypothetical protein